VVAGCSVFCLCRAACLVFSHPASGGFSIGFFSFASVHRMIIASRHNASPHLNGAANKTAKIMPYV
jgi:hypothetical protein